jgi:hypothetical protein
LIFIPCTTSPAIFNAVFKASRSRVFVPMYRHWESYRWKEETKKWSPEWLIRYSTVPCYKNDFRPWK